MNSITDKYILKILIFFLEYSFKNISIKNPDVIDYLISENIEKFKLNRIHTLNLSGTKIMDVSALGNVHTLDLSYTKVTDISAHSNVHTLDLRCKYSWQCSHFKFM